MKKSKYYKTQQKGKALQVKPRRAQKKEAELPKKLREMLPLSIFSRLLTDYSVGDSVVSSTIV